MFETENKMGGLSLLYDSPSIDSVLNWGKSFYKDRKLSITISVNGIRHFVRDTSTELYQYPSCIIQENKRYKVYG